MKFKKIFGIIFFSLLMIVLTAFDLPQQASQPSGYDLVAAVNAYRASKGYYALNPNSFVMAAAQAHAEWIVKTGQGGHIGANGSNETTRVSWTGYGGGAAIHCDECWASGRTIEDAVYNAWSDWTHQEVMLNAWGNRYTDAGGGVAAQGNGRYIFILDVCLVVGKSSKSAVPGATTNPLGTATADLSNYIYGVTVATPMANGKIEHVVQYGQSLASIAKAYNTTVDELRKLNNIPSDSTLIVPDQVLVIRTANSSGSPTSTPTLNPTPSNPLPGTPTTSSKSADPTIIPMPTTEKANPSLTNTPVLGKDNQQRWNTISMILIGMAVIGLLIILASLFMR